MHVKQRQAVNQGVVRRPRPRRGQCVDVGGDRPPTDQHALGRPGRPGGVHDHGGGIRRRLGIPVPRPRMQSDRDVRQALGVGGHLAQPCHRAGVGQDVAALGNSDVGGNGNHGHTRDEAAGDGEHRRRSGGGEDGYAAGTGDALGHRGRRTDEVTSAQRRAIDAHRIAEVVASGNGRGIERGQQHTARLPCCCARVAGLAICPFRLLRTFAMGLTAAGTGRPPVSAHSGLTGEGEDVTDCSRPVRAIDCRTAP